MEESLLQELTTELGLLKWEAKVYLILLHEPRLCAKELSIELSLPLTKTYETLDSLQKKGFLSYVPSIPRQYTAVSPAQLLTELERKKTEQIQKLKSFAKQYFSEHIEQQQKETEKEQIILHTGRSSVHYKLEQLIVASSEFLSFVISDDSFKQLSFHKQLLSEAQGRGVNLKFCCSSAISRIIEGEWSLPATINQIEGIRASMVCSEKKGLLIDLEQSNKLRSANDLTVEIQHKTFLSFLEKGFFG